MPCSNNKFIDDYVHRDIVINEVLISRQTAHYTFRCTHQKSCWPIFRDGPTWHWLLPSTGNCNSTVSYEFSNYFLLFCNDKQAVTTFGTYNFNMDVRTMLRMNGLMMKFGFESKAIIKK